MTKPLRVRREAFERGETPCPACGRVLRSDEQTQYLVGAALPEPIGAALVCDSCSASVRLWFSPAP